MNAVGGSTVAAFASVAVPVVAAVGGYYAYNNYISMSHNTTEYGIRYPKTRRFSSPKPNGSQRFRTNHGSKIGTFLDFLISIISSLFLNTNAFRKSN